MLDGDNLTLEEYRELFEKVIREEQCVKKSDMNIKGKDLIALGMKPGREIGELLHELLELVLENPELNIPEELQSIARRRIQEQIPFGQKHL